MTRRLCVFTAILLSGLVPAEAQESERRLPPFRSLQVASEPGDSVGGRLLPAIELPEFIITGSFAVQPPEVQKLSAVESAGNPVTLAQHSVLTRESRTHALGLKPDGMPASERASRLRGVVRAGIGTFRTPRVALWIGRSESETRYFASAQYLRTSGYGVHTDRSQGSMVGGGGLLLRSSGSAVDQTWVEGEFGYFGESYRMYGSSRPDLQRVRTDVTLQTRAIAGPGILYPADLSMKIATVELTDSSSSLGESVLALAMTGDVSVFGVPWTISAAYSWGMLSRGARRNLTLAELTVAGPTWTVGDLSLRGELQGWIGTGTSGPTNARVSPRVLVGLGISERHSVTVAFRPAARFESLGASLGSNPYLQAETALRHTFAVQHLGLSLNSRWSPSARSTISLDWEALRDVPLYADTAGRGVWTHLYEGRTTRVVLAGDIVANITPIDYFAVGGSISSCSNDAWGGEIPYIPREEASVAYSRVILQRFTVTAEAAFHGRRATERGGGGGLASFVTMNLRTEAVLSRNFRIALATENVLDRKYEVWKGYRGRPLFLGIEVRYCW